MPSEVPGGITALIHTKNEEARIEYAVRSCRGWTDHVLVVDMASTDATREVALRAGATILPVPDFGFADPARQLAVDAVTTDWVFVLDADEIAPITLGERLVTIARANAVDVVRIPHLNYFFGRPLRTTDWAPEHDRHPRFFRRGSLEVSKVVHQPWTVAKDARVVDLPARDELCIHHLSYPTVASFVAKMNSYTDIEARELLAATRSAPTAGRALVAGGREFLRRYIKNRGYRDDYRAFIVSYLMITYRLLAWAKARQLADMGDEAAIQEHHRQVAEQLLAEGDGRGDSAAP